MIEIQQAVEEQEDWIPAEKARERLGVSKGKMARLLADNILPHKEDQLDRRYKYVCAADVDRLIQARMRK